MRQIEYRDTEQARKPRISVRNVAPIYGPYRRSVKVWYGFPTTHSEVGRVIETIAGAAIPRQSVVDAPDREWFEFLRGLPDTDGVSTVAVQSAEDLWAKLRALNVPLPDSMPTAEDGVFMSWDNGAHHVEIETLAEGSYYRWFYMNRTADDDFELQDNVPASEIPPELAERLALIVR